MRIGIVSDSHGKAGRLRKAVDLLLARGVQALVHCGDIGGGDCVDVLADAPVPAYAVAGNMDRHADRLRARAEASGVHFSLETILVPIGPNTHLAVTHGSNKAVLQRLLTEGRYPYVCHGHTHLARDERAGGVRVINPGALRHANPLTVAVLDTGEQTVEYVEVR